MPRFVLDTDTVTLLQRGQAMVVEHVRSIPADDYAVSIITYEEQLRGRLAVVRQATDAARLTTAYVRLREMQEFFCAIRVLDFEGRAAEIYQQLRRAHRKIASMDLRIAATALASNTALVTRNRRDFASIPNLSLADRSVP